MLRHLSLRDFVIVPALELDFSPGFCVLTGETGAGKSILIDALQLVLGGRADALVVREGAARADISAEFDTPASLLPWLDEAGLLSDDGLLLLRRSVDAQGKSRAWVNGCAATVAQLRELAEHLIDIHGQHAWQGLTRAADVRALLDSQAGVSTEALARGWAARQAAAAALAQAQQQQQQIAQERERLSWQIGELDKLAPGVGEWATLSAEQQRLAHAQALLDAAQRALDCISDSDQGPALQQTARALDALSPVVAHDDRLAPLLELLAGAQAQLQDAARALSGYLGRVELEPERLAELDARMGAWLGLARRWRHPPDELPALLAQWRAERDALDAAADTPALQAALEAAERRYLDEAQRVRAARQRAAPLLAEAVTRAMQGLGMAGGRFEVALLPLAEPAAHGLESVELRVAGHAGSTPRPLAKVASGGELSRLALAIAVSTAHGEPAASGAGTLIFDEIDAGIGGAVGDVVGALMKRLGQHRQVLAVTHLAQVAACADHHLVVAKSTLADGRTASSVQAVQGAARVAEVARMLGGERMADTSLAHAQAMLQGTPPSPIPTVTSAAQDQEQPAPRAPSRRRSPT